MGIVGLYGPDKPYHVDGCEWLETHACSPRRVGIVSLRLPETDKLVSHDRCIWHKQETGRPGLFPRGRQLYTHAPPGVEIKRALAAPIFPAFVAVRVAAAPIYPSHCLTRIRATMATTSVAAGIYHRRFSGRWKIACFAPRSRRRCGESGVGCRRMRMRKKEELCRIDCREAKGKRARTCGPL